MSEDALETEDTKPRSKKKGMTDERLLAFLQAHIPATPGNDDGQRTQKRSTATRYYEGREPKPFHTGNSKYVSLDVADIVDTTKAVLLEIFTGNKTPVRFSPLGMDDVRGANIATSYTAHVVFAQNPGYFVIQDAIHDGLLHDIGVSEVYWLKNVEEIEEEMEGLEPEAIPAILQDLEAKGAKLKDIEVELDEETGTAKLEYKRVVDRSKCVIEPVPPEEFGMSARAKDIASARVVWRKQRRTISWLLKQGYDKALVDKLSADEKNLVAADPEVLERFEVMDVTDEALSSLQKANREVELFAAYTELDMDGSDKAYLYKIIVAGNVILDKERVSRKPFIGATPLRRPHSARGIALADRVIPTQNARTTLIRGIIDHTNITNNPRYQVVRGALVNPKELLENRLGGVVNVTRPDAVAPLMQAPLNPYVFQVDGKLDADKEAFTGVSRLAQGLNKDAVSKQNSNDMIGNLVTLSQQRQKMMARNLAYGYIADLFLLVYQVVIENEKTSRVHQVAGDWVPVDPSDWAERNSVTVEFSLGYNEEEKESDKYLAMDQYLTQAGLGPQYGPKERYEVLKRSATHRGIVDFEVLLQPPTEENQPQPDPLVMKKVELEERKIALEEKKVELEMLRLQVEGAGKAEERGLKAQHLQTTDALAAHREERADLELAHQIATDNRELDILEATPKPTAIASPNP